MSNVNSVREDTGNRDIHCRPIKCLKRVEQPQSHERKQGQLCANQRAREEEQLLQHPQPKKMQNDFVSNSEKCALIGTTATDE